MTGQTFYPWRSESGGPGIDQARRLRPPKSENSRPMRAGVDLALDNRILREASGGYFWALHVVAVVWKALTTLLCVSQQEGAMTRQPPVLIISAWSKAACCCGGATLSASCYNGNRERKIGAERSNPQ